MIQLSEASLQLGTKILLEGANLTVHAGHKSGVIGANGSGKSSLFKVLLSELPVDSGNFSIPSQWAIAHMAQEVGMQSCSALDYVLSGDPELVALRSALESGEEDGEALAKLYEQLEAIDGYSADARAQQLLSGLGFNAGDELKKVDDFSGGWRIRLNLAKALMCRSDLLLLDEPTNHLDLDACLWLERWLQSYPGTLVIISHDRDFLDNVVGQIVSFEQQKLVVYTGGYSDYERQKAARLAEQEAAFSKQQERIAEIENFVRRFRAKATKAKQAQSRLKELERMEKIAPAHVDSPFNFRFFEPDKLPQQMINMTQADVGYPGKTILNEINLSILGSTRVALLGANGAGKTTLIKSLAGVVPLVVGERAEGTHLRVGYFAQHQLEALDLQASCFLHLQRMTPNATEQSVRNFLGGFDFHGDRVFEAIEHFSGGEKARLALAMLAWQKPNLLLLDEPTNHLDIEVRHALTVALQAFEGAIIMISHDRHLIKNTVDQFWLVDHGKVQPFEGDLEDYYQYLQAGNTTSSKPSAQSGSAKKVDKKADRQAAAAKRDALKPITQKIKKIDKALEKVQAQLATLNEQLADSSLYEGDPDKLTELLKQQGEAKNQESELEEEWLGLQEELEQLESS